MSKKLKIHWDKLGVFVAMFLSYWAIASQLFSINTDIRNLAERIAKLEVKVEKIEEKLK